MNFMDNIIDIQQEQKRSKNGTLENTGIDLYPLRTPYRNSYALESVRKITIEPLM